MNIQILYSTVYKKVVADYNKIYDKWDTLLKALHNEYECQCAFENPSYFGVKTFVCDLKQVAFAFSHKW